MEMEEILARDGQKSTGGKTFVQKNFDWIGGTSTGGVINKRNY
jgi:patatin-like phospholipase/acyl hydrolase